MEQLSFDDLEAWKPVVGYEGMYEVSYLGRVRSVDRAIFQTGSRPCFKTRHGKMMSIFPMKSTGYLCVRLCRDGRAVTRTVHSLVLEAFHGPCPEGMESLHGKGGQHDNSAPNLHWGTRSENTLDQVRAGTHHHARKQKCPKGHEYDYIVPGTNKRHCNSCRRNSLEEEAA